MIKQSHFSQIEFAIFGGNINAKAVISCFSGWRATGKFMLKSANAPQLLAAFASKTGVDIKTSVEGKLNMVGDFSSQSTDALKLADAPIKSANIALKMAQLTALI